MEVHSFLFWVWDRLWGPVPGLSPSGGLRSWMPDLWTDRTLLESLSQIPRLWLRLILSRNIDDWSR